jgi:uncharacterized protein YkwD
MRSSLTLFLLLAGACADSEGDTAQAGFTFTAMEEDVHEQINAYRESQGLAPLGADETIGEASRGHSQDMLDEKVEFGHDGFESRVVAIDKVLDLSTAGENVAYNVGFDDPATTAVQQWLDSPPHLENVIGDYELAGVGIAKGPGKTFYFTQIFVKEF